MLDEAKGGDRRRHDGHHLLPAPLPHRRRNGAYAAPFIVADEFAELKQQEPDSLEGLISAARMSRPLGVPEVLMPEARGRRLDQISANSRFRCA